MKKITKRQHTALTKKNDKMLADVIAGFNHDMLEEAKWLKEWDPQNTNKAIDDLANEYKETTAYWAKELKAAFRDYKTTKKNLQKALKRS